MLTAEKRARLTDRYEAARQRVARCRADLAALENADATPDELDEARSAVIWAEHNLRRIKAAFPREHG